MTYIVLTCMIQLIFNFIHFRTSFSSLHIYLCVQHAHLFYVLCVGTVLTYMETLL